MSKDSYNKYKAYFVAHLLPDIIPLGHVRVHEVDGVRSNQTRVAPAREGGGPCGSRNGEKDPRRWGFILRNYSGLLMSSSPTSSLTVV